LRQRASDYLRRVEAGETFEVTNRGRPVAILSGIPDASPLERLRSAGEVIEPQGSMEDAPLTLETKPGVEPPSAQLAWLREDER
jgi:prevent-host-death family protein